MRIEFTKSPLADMVFWKRADRRTALKIADLLDETCRDPFSGRSKPEQLRHALSGYWSRRINQKDRLVYRVDEERGTVVVISVLGHY